MLLAEAATGFSAGCCRESVGKRALRRRWPETWKKRSTRASFGDGITRLGAVYKTVQYDGPKRVLGNGHEQNGRQNWSP